MTDPETVADVLADGRRIEAEVRRLFGESEGDMLGNVLDRIERAMAASAVPVATYTTGHCKNNAQPGGCQLHNLQCGYPSCDRQPVIPPTVPVESLGRDAPIGCTAEELLEDAIRNASRAPASVPDGLTISPTHCGCHPETCCCGPYTLSIGDTTITQGTKKQLTEIVAQLGLIIPEPRT